MSMLEIYNETVRDLLGDGDGKSLDIRQARPRVTVQSWGRR
jgi:hypothetical protein